jgi:hypothetical protein
MLKLKRPALKKPDYKSRRFIVLLLVIIIAIAGGVVFYNSNPHRGEKVYAEVAGHKIYGSEIDDLLGKRKEISAHDAATVLADKYLTEKLGKEKGINITNKDLLAQYGKEIQKQKKNNRYNYQKMVNDLYFTKLQAYNNGVYKGDLIIANFSRHVEFLPVLPEDKAKDPLLGKASAIAKDKKYAKNLMNRLYDGVISGKISFKQAMDIEHKDPQVGIREYSSLPHSTPFDTSLYTNPILNVTSIKEKINSIKAGDTTRPFVVRVGNSLSGKSTAESYFLMIHMDKSSGSYSGMSFQKYIDKTKQTLGYKINV